MRLILEIGSVRFEVDTNGIDISIPLLFNGPQPNSYNVPHASGMAYEADGFIGDTRKGGGCNFETYTLTPHCNGTHTEGIGHVSKDRISLLSVLKESLIPASVLSIVPEAGQSCGEHYSPEFGTDDMVISRMLLENAWNADFPSFKDALIIRTIPNTENKKSRDYMQDRPAFFTHEAMRWVREKGIKHLLTDLPSVDRLHDEGKLSAHHIFWQMDQGSHEVNDADISPFTITEFVYVPDSVSDGIYLLNLQIAAWETDAAPSRPLLYRLSQVGE